MAKDEFSASNKVKTQAWAKVPRFILGDKRLTYLLFRVLICLQTYADPNKPERPVWASPKTIALHIGLNGKHAAGEVRKAINILESLDDYIKRLSAKGELYSISLQPLLKRMEGESPLPPAAGEGLNDLPQEGELPSSTEQTNKPTIFKRKQTTFPKPEFINKRGSRPSLSESPAFSAERLCSLGVTNNIASRSLSQLGDIFSDIEVSSIIEKFAAKTRKERPRNATGAWLAFAQKCLQRAMPDMAAFAKFSFSSRENLETSSPAHKMAADIAKGVKPPGMKQADFEQARRIFLEAQKELVREK